MKTRRQIIRFIIAGTFANATDFGIYFLLIHFLPFSLAKGISFTCAGVVSYLISKHWIFQGNPLSSYAEIIRYILISISALEINVLTNQSILNLLPGSVLLALISAAMLTGLFTIVCFKWWFFITLKREEVYFV